MKLKHTLILTVLSVALNGASVANAAVEKPAKEEKAEKTQPVKKDKSTDNAEQSKQGSTGRAEDSCCRKPSSAGKKLPHDHH